MIPVEPAFEGDEPWAIYGRTAQFTFPQVQPGWTFHVTLHYTGSERPRLRFEMKEGILRATEASLETFFLANEVCILLTIIAVWVWVLFLLIWTYHWWREPGRHSSAADEPIPRC